jgi:hypothetical protein
MTAVRDVLWIHPLKVTLRSGLERTFVSVYEALDFLENEWPLKHGRRHDIAISCCKGALNRMTPATVAREAFIAACLEADMAAVVAAPLPYGRMKQGGASTAL